MASEEKKRLLLIDYRNLLCRALFANRTLAWNGMPTGGIYGFLNVICSLTMKNQIDRVIVCKDMGPYHRKQDYPAYKADRKEWGADDVKAMASADSQVNELLKFLKIRVVWEKGWEADDIIAQYCFIKARRYPQIYVCSTDSDLFQLFKSREGAVYLCHSKGLYGIDTFKEKYPEIKPWQWPKVTALMGSHNGVPGIKGVGEKTAVKLVAEGLPLSELAKKYKIPFEELKLRVQLSTYPYPAISPGPSLLNSAPIEYSRNAFVRYVAQYGINLTAYMDSALERLATP